MALNYGSYFAGVQNPIDQTLKGVQQGFALSGMVDKQKEQEALAQQAILKQQQAQQMQSDLAGLAELEGNNKATKSDYRAMMTKYPSLANTLKEPLGALSTEQAEGQKKSALELYSVLQTGQTDLAKQMLDRRIQAAENSGDEEALIGAKAMRQTLDIDPRAAKASAGLFLASSMGDKEFANSLDKLNKVTEDAGLYQARLDKAIAESDLTRAQANKEKVLAKKAEAEIAKTNVDAQKVALESAAEAIKLKQEAKGNNIKLSAKAEDVINKAVQEQMNLRSLSSQYDSLAKEIDDNIKSGVIASAQESVKKFVGNQDKITMVRLDYKRLRNSQIISSLPPGPATDRDIEIIAEGFPDETATPESLRNFLSSMSRLNKLEAQVLGAQAEWTSKVGTLQPTTREITVNGVTIPEGTSFAEATDLIFGEQQEQQQQTQMQEEPTADNQILLDADKILGL